MLQYIYINNIRCMLICWILVIIQLGGVCPGLGNLTFSTYYRDIVLPFYLHTKALQCTKYIMYTCSQFDVSFIDVSNCHEFVFWPSQFKSFLMMSETFLYFLQVGLCPHHTVGQDFCELSKTGREKAVRLTENNNKLFIWGRTGSTHSHKISLA